jgi:CBS domain-containing protein
MQVKDIMTHNPEVVRPDALLQEVADMTGQGFTVLRVRP